MSNDYTDDATATDIEQALASSRTRRRDSSLGTSYADEPDAIFGGASHALLPSSVSTMPHERRMARRLSKSSARSRRRSGASEVSEQDRPRATHRASADSQALSDGEYASEPEGEPVIDDARSAATRQSGRHRRSSSSDEVEPRSFFDNLANIFNARSSVQIDATSRRNSLSRRSSRGSARRRRSSHASGAEDASSGEERWGYSSDEDQSNEEEELVMDEHRVQARDLDIDDAASVGGYASEDQGSSVGHLPMLSGDPLFGDTRIDMEDETAALLPGGDATPPSGPPSRQTIYLADEDSNIRFVGYYSAPLQNWLWRAGCIGSAGILALLGNWVPTLWLRFVAREKAFKDIQNGFVVVEASVYRAVPVHR